MCLKFIEQLNKISKKTFYIPTEAEWEYACRAGTSNALPWNENKIGEYTWLKNNAKGFPHPVKSLKPNPWGFYNMLGNVREWCSDWYDGNYYHSSVINSHSNLKKVSRRQKVKSIPPCLRSLRAKISSL